MEIMLTTDTHFNHDKMIEYCGRPKNFEEKIAKGLFSIPKTNILIHLGDVCIGNDAEIHSKYIEPLDCKKWLIKGNHDSKSNSWYLSHGWDFVAEKIEDVFFGKKILFSHTPQPDTGFDINIHGHFHNQLPRLLRGEWAVDGERERNHYDLKVLTSKHKLLALEYMKYQPVSLEKFISTL